jgi:hypothetical protein
MRKVDRERSSHSVRNDRSQKTEFLACACMYVRAEQHENVERENLAPTTGLVSGRPETEGRRVFIHLLQ